MIYAANPAVHLDQAIVAVPVIPEYQHHPRYLGVLQWCSGPNMPVRHGEAVSKMFTLKANIQTGFSTKFHFRILRSTTPPSEFTTEEVASAILKAFKTACANSRIKMVFDEPFKEPLEDELQRQRIISTFRAQFEELYST